MNVKLNAACYENLYHFFAKFSSKRLIKLFLTIFRNWVFFVQVIKSGTIFHNCGKNYPQVKARYQVWGGRHMVEYRKICGF